MSALYCRLYCVTGFCLQYNYFAWLHGCIASLTYHSQNPLSSSHSQERKHFHSLMCLHEFLFKSRFPVVQPHNPSISRATVKPLAHDRILSDVQTATYAQMSVESVSLAGGDGLHRIIVGVDYGTTFRYVRTYVLLQQLVLSRKPRVIPKATSKSRNTIFNARKNISCLDRSFF